MTKETNDKLGGIIEGVLGIISDEKERIYNEPNFYQKKSPTIDWCGEIKYNLLVEIENEIKKLL